MSKLATLAALAVGMATATAEARGKPFIPSGLLDGLKTASDFASGVVDTVGELHATTAEAVKAVDDRVSGLAAAVDDAAGKVSGALATLQTDVSRQRDDVAELLAKLADMQAEIDALKAAQAPKP